MKKRLLATLLSLCLLVGLLPTAALAVEDGAQSPADVTIASRSVWAGDENNEGTKTNPWEISDTVTAYLEQNNDDNASPTYTCFIQGTGLCPNYSDTSKTPWYTWIDQITKVVIGEGITLTGIDTFSDADALVEVELPSTLTQINADTFSGCGELERVTFLKGRAAKITIGNRAFAGCKNLEEFDFSNVDAFNWDSFSGAGLTKAVFPESVRWIGSSSFYGTPLKRVLIEATESPMEDSSSWPAFGNIAEESIIYVQNDSIFENHDYSYTHHRTVIANLNGGEFAEGYSYDDEAFVLPQLNEKDGKAFDGWYISGTDVRLEGNIPVKDRAGDWFPAEARWGTPDETNIGDIGLILERPSHFISPAQVGDVTALSPHVTVMDVQWKIGDDPMATEGFEYGNDYTVAVTVVLEEGYSCSGKGYINEAAATVSSGTVPNQYILTYTYPTLEKKTVRVYGDNLTYTGTPRMEFELGSIYFPSSGISSVTEGTPITMSISPKRGYGIDEDTLHVYRYTDRTQEIEVEPAGRNKYTFVMPSFDVYVPEPTFELQTYSITYEGLDGAVYDQDAYVDSYTVNDTVTLPDPTKEGFIFAGWKVNEEYLEYLPLEDHSGAYTIDKAEDLVMTACWKSTEGVTLHVESFGGSDPVEDVFLSDEVLFEALNEGDYSGISLPNLSAVPELEGYEFLFWHIDYMDLAQYEDGLADIRDSYLAQIQSLRESIESEGNDLPEDLLQTYLNVCGLGEYSWDHSLLLGNGAAVSGDFSVWYDTIAEQYLDRYISQFSFGKELTYPYPLWYYLALVRLSYGADLPELTIYATYLKDGSIVDHYQLTYESNGGTAYDAEHYLDRTTATLDKTPMKSGYDFAGWYADSGLTQRVTYLTMDGNKTVYAGWTPQSTDPGTDPGGSTGGGGSSTTTYLITVEDSRHGDVESNRTRAGSGSTVTLTVTPDEGYELATLTATDKDGKKLELTNKGDGEYTFKMPASKVTVQAVFQEIPPDYASCDGGASCPLNHFTDTDPAAWYHDGVHFCLDNGMMAGYGNGLFGPNDQLSRAMLVQILYNKEGRPAVTGESAFDDVAGDAWYADAVTWAAANGVVDGYGNGKYGPNDPITREQLATILYRYAQAKGYDVSVGEDTNILSYTDALETSEYAIPAMQWACGAGIIQGNGGYLNPQGDATRAEIATMLMRFCGYYANTK